MSAPKRGFRVEARTNRSWDPRSKAHVLYLQTPPGERQRVVLFHAPLTHGNPYLWFGEYSERSKYGDRFGSCWSVSDDPRSLRAFAEALLWALDAAHLPRKKRKARR